jgi:RNA polymerase sigma factor (sigma-70 family)
MTAVDVSAYRRWSYALAHGMLANAPWCGWEADDLAQEAMVAIWRAGEKYRPEIGDRYGNGALATFVTKAARTRLAELVYRDRPSLGAGDRTRSHGSRNSGVYTSSLDAHLDTEPDEIPRSLVVAGPDAATLATRQAVRAAVGELPERERLAVCAVDLLGMTSAEAAPLVGVTEGSLRSVRRRAHGRLRETLTPAA